jgi:hypothetical protein
MPKVVIDGVQYIPMPAPLEDADELMRALEVRFDSDAGDNLTVREYLRILLDTLWVEEEGFSGKRPFGNSGWKYELYEPLVRDGFLPGEVEDGRHFPDSYEDADQYVRLLIQAMTRP